MILMGLGATDQAQVRHPYAFAQGFGVTVSPFLAEEEGPRRPWSCVMRWDASLGEEAC